ncbi:MAG: type I-U CRISPR-associated protein Cas5/Cas6 [Acidobacteriia bacterium]|nr:type I-U CRISPR-associated protein Cas5/Cas6 [Terriglobia bacterium]
MSLLKPATEFTQPSGHIIRFTFTRGRPPVCSTVAVAEAFRAAALSAFHAITGSRDSFLLAGHQPNGQPDKGHHHAYYLPQPTTDGALIGIVVVSPYLRFSGEELEALRIVRALQWNGPSTRICLELSDADDQCFRQLASRWVSATPYVPLRRFWGTHGKRHLAPENQLRQELEQVANCEPGDIHLARWGDIRVRMARRNANNGLSLSNRLAFTGKLHTEKPICGPVALGHSCHFGLGLFVPVTLSADEQ